jgi:hypothetical protein
MSHRSDPSAPADPGRRTVVASEGSLPRTSSRLKMRRADVLIVERASVEIASLGTDLDRRLEAEARPKERLRMIRETTNQITRVANDAINAYVRASRAVRAEELRAEPDLVAANAMRTRLNAARAAVLSVLDEAQGRYASLPSVEVPTPGA